MCIIGNDFFSSKHTVYSVYEVNERYFISDFKNRVTFVFKRQFDCCNLLSDQENTRLFLSLAPFC